MAADGLLASAALPSRKGFGRATLSESGVLGTGSFGSLSLLRLALLFALLSIVVPILLVWLCVRFAGGTGGTAGTAQAAVLTPPGQVLTTWRAEESLPTLLHRAGVGDADAWTVATLVAQVIPPEQIEPGSRLALHFESGGMLGGARPLRTLTLRPRLDLALSVERQGNRWQVRQQSFSLAETHLRLQGRIEGGGVYRSLRNAGVPAEIAESFLQAIDQFVPIDSIEPGDRFDLVLSRQHAGDGATEAADLLYAAISRADHTVLRLVRQDNGAYVSPDGTEAGPVSVAGMVAPVAGSVSSSFGMRHHPILGGERMHAGVDFAAHWGSPIHAVSDGRVVFAGWHGGHGLFVKLDHGSANGSGYGHMSRVAVSPGELVRAGQVIGYVGSTGLSTGPHLHYELYRNGQVVDPLATRFLVRRAAADPRRQAALRQRLQQMLAMAPGIEAPAKTS